MENTHFKNSVLRKHLNPIIIQWIKNINKYSEKCGSEDALYWYNERANVGILSAAAWQCGYFSLEEFSAEKRTKSKENKYSGRIDLWISCKNTEYVFEAKQEYVSISQRATKYEEKIERKLKSARKDAVNSKEGNQKAVGLVFVVPYLPCKEKENSESLIQEFLSDIRGINYDFLAYTFPDISMHLSWDDKYIYPGVVLIGRVPRRTSS